MSTLVTTAEVPPDDRLDVVRELTATTWVPMECRAETGAPYQGEFRASGMGPMQVVVLDTTPITVSRTRALIEQADPDLLKLFMVCSGTSVVEQDGRQAFLSPAEFTLYDTRRPYVVRCGVGDDRPTRLLTFMFPPSVLPLPRGRLGGIAATRIPATTGLGDLTARFLLELADTVDLCTPAEAARLSTAALEVLATRLAREADVGAWTDPDHHRRALLTTVQAFALQHLGDPQLSPAGIAAAHHISLRSLHQLFHDEGLTVAGWIRQRRLERCRRDLADPGLAHRPVAAIAARWAFSSAADFSRAFRAAHAMTPSEYRSHARSAHRPAR